MLLLVEKQQFREHLKSVGPDETHPQVLWEHADVTPVYL